MKDFIIPGENWIPDPVNNRQINSKKTQSKMSLGSQSKHNGQ